MTLNSSVQRILLLVLVFFGLLGQAQAESFTEQAGTFLTSPTVTGVLLTLGILFWFLSVLTMGTGVAEVLCFSTFALLFGGRYLVGQELWVPMALFLAGAIFAAVEVFIIPGLGVFGVLSMVSFAGLSVLLMESPQTGLAIFCLSVLLSMVCGFVVIKFMPKFFMTRKLLVLEPPVSSSADSVAIPAPSVHPGDVGEVAASLRPVGAALFGTDRIEVVSDGEFLKKGVKVEVVRVEGQKVVVRSCQC
jgi:membrane-bound serine protease (ClpP class)